MIVEINKSPNADSRTARGDVSFEEFSKSTDMHREDVKNMCYMLADMLRKAGDEHDWTKKEKEKEFYEDFKTKKGEPFKKADWYQYHIHTERHHINSYVHPDVNLIDVLEMIADCCCAGIARSGKIYGLEVDPKVLMKAFKNTCKLVEDSIHLND